MDDKILIKSNIAQKAKKTLLIAPLILIGMAIYIIVIAFASIEETYRFFDEPASLTLFILSCSFVFIAIVIYVVYWACSKCELTVTENNVKGKTLFGKEVVLPLYMISAYSTRKFLSTVAVATSSGITKFALIGNYYEIGRILSQKINERQEATATPKSTPAPQSNSMDDLKKLKDLLDAGIITQEEFEAKKKQLLGI